MTYTADRFTQSTNVLDAVSTVQAAIRNLSTDEKLGLFWVIYENLGRAITPAAPGAAREQFTQGLLVKVKALSYEQQLQFMRDLVNRISNPLTRAYGSFTNNNKLAFWYQLAVGMTTGEIIPVPDNYKLSNAGLVAFSKITTLEFGQQITLLRKFVMEMGIDPLAV
ncbi:MAG: orange carotenoid protein N-terminal domain-containing protein [Cyanobacteria bacterium P01_F01_bin.143]